LEKLDKVVTDGKREMKAAANGASSSHNSRCHQSMVQLHKIIWGWSQSFRHTTAKQIFETLDKDIDKRIAALNTEANSLMPTGDAAARRRVMGLHLLADTQEHSLPNIDRAA
jgi:hypothetical protein